MPRENRKDLREVPRRVLKAMRIVLVEHMDDVLREALCLPSPEQVFGPRKDVMEYVAGELVTTEVPLAPGGPKPPAGEPSPAPAPL